LANASEKALKARNIKKHCWTVQLMWRFIDRIGRKPAICGLTRCVGLPEKYTPLPGLSVTRAF